MTNLVRSIASGGSVARSGDPFSFEAFLSYFNYGGNSYGLNYPNVTGLNQTLIGQREEIGGDFMGYVQGAYRSNGVIFACMLVRMLLYSEARFQFRRLQTGRPGEYFGTTALTALEKPWPNGTTGDLLKRMIIDADLAGNAYFYRASLQSDTITRLRPDWVTIVMGSKSPPRKGVEFSPYDLDAELIGYIYRPGGYGSEAQPVHLDPEQVAHFAPIPDPLALYRGMSWLTPVVREVMADSAATLHKLMFFENGATPNMVVTLDASIQQDAFDAWVEAFESEHEGVLNAYKTIYLGGGATTEVVGANMRELDFKNTQGAGETRIAAAAGVPPVIVGLSEGLAAATYSNYGQARRRFADGTMRPLWRDSAACLATLIKVPKGAQLWYDDRDIPFLQEDQKDAAEVQQLNATAIKTLVDSGYEPSTVIEAVDAGDLGRLSHSGLISVQLQPATKVKAGLFTGTPTTDPNATDTPPPTKVVPPLKAPTPVPSTPAKPNGKAPVAKSDEENPFALARADRITAKLAELDEMLAKLSPDDPDPILRAAFRELVRQRTDLLMYSENGTFA